jgi:hypothetical protein
VLVLPGVLRGVRFREAGSLVGKEERGAFGVARAWDCLFGEAERLNCVCYDLLSWRIELAHGKDVIGIGNVDISSRDKGVDEVAEKPMSRVICKTHKS